MSYKIVFPLRLIGTSNMTLNERFTLIETETSRNSRTSQYLRIRRSPVKVSAHARLGLAKILTGQPSRGGSRTIFRRVPLQQAAIRPQVYQGNGAPAPRRPAPPRLLQRFNDIGRVGGNARPRIARPRAPLSTRTRGSAGRQRFPPWQFNRRNRLPLSSTSPSNMRTHLDAELKEYMNN
uniref:Uncharacterized protein n=1 Tax=Schistocephalus solidus TaxID=70667 RepID=A0A0X3PDB6_SCHSO